MKTLSLRVATLLAFVSAVAFGQTALNQTTTSSAITSSQTSFVIGSATGVAVTSGTNNGSILYVVDPGASAGEAMYVNGITSTTVSVRRGANGTKAVAHVTGAMVLVGPPAAFVSVAPSGSCTAANTAYTPVVNVLTGHEWLCSTATNVLAWVPGFQNVSAPASATATVASAAGAILPSGPLFTVSGTAAITGFTVPVGFKSGSFSVIPTGIFTWTTAGNIGLAGTAVVGRVITFTWDPVAGKFYPSYV